MKGLLAKDLALMMQRGRVFIFLLVWGIVIALVMDSNTYSIGWIVMVATISSISTISYDEYDNCMPFLMSLPVTRREYAIEKYVFSAAAGVISWVLAVMIGTIACVLKGSLLPTGQDFLGMLAYMPVILLIISVMIPPQLKWGPEKGRTVMMVAFGVAAVVIFLVERYAGGVEGAMKAMDSLSLPGVFLGIAAVCIALTALSIWLSIRIMEKKEF